jgi:hypothetical protein
MNQSRRKEKVNFVASKKRFLEFIEKQIKDDEFVVMSNSLSGQLSANQKRNTKSATFDFAADAFAQKGIGHIYLGKTPVVAICICPPEFISEKTLSEIEKAESVA